MHRICIISARNAERAGAAFPRTGPLSPTYGQAPQPGHGDSAISQVDKSHNPEQISPRSKEATRMADDVPAIGAFLHGKALETAPPKMLKAARDALPHGHTLVGVRIFSPTTLEITTSALVPLTEFVG